MAYKNVLAQVNDGETDAARLQALVPFCARWEARLIGVHVVPPPYIPTYTLARLPEAAYEAHYAAANASAERAKKLFEHNTAAMGEQAVWRQLEGRVDDTLKHQARYADIVVLGQPDPDTADPEDMALAGEVLLGAGRPVLMVPYAGTPNLKASNVLIAWSASREGARALSDAMPLLLGAETVTVLVVDTDPDAPLPGPSEDEPPAETVAETLQRHGVNAKPSHVVATKGHIGDIILSEAASGSADLVVAGAYGHARLRELLFGGVTRTLLEQMPVPVLFSH